jgi:hypothetical protein
MGRLGLGVARARAMTSGGRIAMTVAIMAM